MYWHTSLCLKRPSFCRRPAPAPAAEDVRLDLVERVRREIAEGTYETPEKWEAALDRLLDRLERD